MILNSKVKYGVETRVLTQHTWTRGICAGAQFSKAPPDGPENSPWDAHSSLPLANEGDDEKVGYM